jgi:hypothetical protein
MIEEVVYFVARRVMGAPLLRAPMVSIHEMATTMVDYGDPIVVLSEASWVDSDGQCRILNHPRAKGPEDRNEFERSNCVGCDAERAVVMVVCATMSS